MIEQLKKHLLEIFVKVSDEWLSACIQFIKSEHGINNTGNFLWMKEKVYEQWLYTDLTTLGIFCVPFSLSKQKWTTISGHFTLQVNHIRDVGLPAYSQLQKLHKDDVENANVSAENVHAAAWEPKPSRMLLLQLTDGTSVIQGMEYRPISCLSLTMKPGVKILLRGSIEVRRGILLLTRDHVTVLGGEVETLLLPNAPENMLRKMLMMEESEDPISITEPLVQNVISTQEPSQYYNSQSTQNLSTRTSNHSMVIPALDSRNPPVSASSANEFSDDLEDFMDSEMELALIEAEQKASTLTAFQPRKMQIVTPQSSHNPHTAMNENGFPTFSNSASSQVGSSLPALDNTRLTRGRAGNRSASSFTQPSRSNSFEDDSFGDDDELLLLAEFEIPAAMSFMSAANNPSRVVAKSSCVTRPFIQPNPHTASRSNGVLREEYRVPARSFSHFKSKVHTTANHDDDTLKQSSPTHVSIGKLNDNQLVPKSSSNLDFNLKQKKLSSYIFDKKQNREITVDSNNINSVSCSAKSIRSKLGEKPPYQYICYMKFNPVEKVSYTILGFVTTLLSKLEQSDGKWHLAAKINDGTGSCDVDIDDVVLRELMGMTVEEFKTQKEEAVFNPHLKNALGQRLCRCQMELIRMCRLLKVENAPSLPRPKIVDLLPLTELHLHHLRERSNSL